MADRELWSLRVDEATTREALQSLDAQLVALGLPWAGSLRFKIGAKLARLKIGAATSTASGPALAADYGLPPPDGRWLYRYRLTGQAFDRLQADLGKRSLGGLERGHWPALFVLWASEWFRRCYRGGGHRWIDLARALDMAEDQALFRRITAAGLRLWRRGLLSGGTGSEYLGSLAREGGFPAAAVEDGGSGWAQAVLKAIVAPLLAEPAAGEERALELAAMQKPRLPQLFRDNEFLALCADLSLAVVSLRREADGPAAVADMAVTAWLELHQPGWQQRLPLSTSDRAAEALIEGLMKVEALSGDAVGVERFLLRDGQCWCEAVRITLDGALDSAATRALDTSCGRLRVFAAGEMARSLPGELAMLEAPVDGEIGWTARSTKRARGVHPLPFAAAIEFDLRSGEQRVARIALAGGKPRRGALIVTEVAEGDAAAPTLLRVIGSGSGKYRADTVVVQVPRDWRVDATGGESVELIGSGVGQTQLWRVTGGAFVTDADGDRFRVLCGQPQDEPNRIELLGTLASWAEVAGDVDLFAGPPLARVGQGSLCVRAIGTRAWAAAPKPLPVGHYELGWRRDGIILDRRRIAVLPVGAEISRGGSPQKATYTLAGFGACSIDPAEDAPVRVVSDRQWQTKPTACLAHWFTAYIEWPDGPALPVRVNHPTVATIARWDGAVLPHQKRITLADLPDLVAVNAGRVQMTGELLQNGRPVAEMTWEIVDELPMASVSADIASLLLPQCVAVMARREVVRKKGFCEQRAAHRTGTDRTMRWSLLWTGLQPVRTSFCRFEIGLALVQPLRARRGMLIRSAVMAGIGLVVSSAALAQTDLSMFSGSPVQPAEVKKVCDAQIALNQPGYFPFCGTVIATHLGDEQFREFYEGDGNNPFITVSQAQAFARQADRVAALRGTPATCLGSNLDACLATLSTALFVTSHPFEPQWVPGEPMVENQSLEFIGFKPPVYDELARFDRQLNREVGLGLIVAPGERVIAVAIRASLKEANLTYAVKSGLLEALHAANPTCQPAGSGVQALKQVLDLSLEDGDSGAFASAKLVLCGRLAEVFRFQPTSSGIDTPAQRITITFREAKPRAKPQRPARAVKR